MKLADLSNEQVLSGLHALVGRGRVILARLLAYLGEVEERRLDLKAACSSLFDFCVHRLGMSDDEAGRRVMASRLARRFPIALGMLERGEIHLTAFLLLREHLTEANHEELLQAAAGKTKIQVQELLAERFPRPDVPSRIRALPSESTPPTAGSTPAVAAKAGLVEPLSPERYKVQFTASKELQEKLDHATNLMRHVNPNGDISVIVERALDLLIGELEKRRLGKVNRPSSTTTNRNARPGYVTREVRRQVFERDGAQCTFRDEIGRRCESRAFLELDHVKARALGGSNGATNLRIRCKAHNALAAELDFGREHIAKKIAEKRMAPRQRDYESDMALGALTSLGFKEQQARRALARVKERWADMPPPLETVLRETISLLT
ncbi:hypothetical protein LVJ94_33070 [Pendulispora rubella]|uniref:HNH nuclease domain-containing protein n=1 Tax=Pendulispora rubella TaxID=2741070 RepID=A0ABZ2KUI6_9BACT